METATVVVTRPMTDGDPTEYTYYWAEEGIKILRDYGYDVIDIQKDDVTYENVSNTIKSYHPRLYIHVGHGCPTSLQGQTECIITRKFDVDELFKMDNFKDILMPLIYSSGCTHTCKLEKDICSPVCTNNTNVDLLSDTIVYTIACYSASQLGKCAVKYGADAYIGYKDLLLFPVDDMNSQDIFKNVHLTFIKSLAEGHTVAQAQQEMNAFEDTLIKFYKKTKYVSLPLLWNKKNRLVLGNADACIY